MNFFVGLHDKYVFQRRIKVIANEIVKIIPNQISILDIGCGDGNISNLVKQQKENIRYQGIDIMARPKCAIPFQVYDGVNIPANDGEFDAAQYVDVLHHVPDEYLMNLLKETCRVTNRYLIIKDHLWQNAFDYQTLKFMDWVGNAPYGVKVIYNFKTEKFWLNAFEELGLEVVSMQTKIPLYPGIFNLIFGRKLHFVALLRKKN